MDIPETKNKMVVGAENKSADMPSAIKAHDAILNEYFFPGGGRWKPMTVNALTLEEATEIHRQKREAVSQEGTKVEENKETNNE